MRVLASRIPDSVRHLARVRLGVAALIVCALVASGNRITASGGGDGTTTTGDDCGGENQRACTIDEFVFGHSSFVGCATGLTQIPPLLGLCGRFDLEGFPSFCGGRDERPCSIFEHIPSCKEGLAEVPFPGGNCTPTDDQGYPITCGGPYKRPCTLIPLEHLLRCHVGYSPEDVQDGSGRVECRAACGQNGQRPCGFFENAAFACAAGLEVLPSDFGVCGKLPEISSAGPPNEVPRGGLRTVVFIHGRSQDQNDGVDPPPGTLLHRLFTDAPNIKRFYGVDYNMAGDSPRKLRTYRFFASCPAADNCMKTWGTSEFDSTSVRIDDVARSIADAIERLPTEGEVTLIGYSFGAIMARQVVYRHFSELAQRGKRIAEVITIGGPHHGGGGGSLEISDTWAGLPIWGSFFQTLFACAPVGIFGEVADRPGCELGQRVAWMANRENGQLEPGAPWFIDNRNYPGIRWINVAGSGLRLDVDSVLEQLSGIPIIAAPFVHLLQNLKTQVPFHDSDATVSVRSALGIAADECYPFLRQAAPSGAPSAEVVPVTRYYQVAVNGITQVQDAHSAVCYHADARSDPRVAEGIDSTISVDQFPNELLPLNHGHMLQNQRVQSFVVAALNLLGDTNGDGVVNANDVRADAGGDSTLECTGTLTNVTLNASASVVGSGPTSYTWRGPFGTATGATAVVALPAGLNRITVEVETGGFRSADEVIVTVVDTTKPALSTVIGHTVEATAAAGTPFTLSPEATDLCGPVTLRLSPELSIYPLGSTDVTVTATDQAGNVSVGTVTVTVVDTTAPAITPPPNVHAEANAVMSTIAMGSATATDIFPVTITSDAPATFPLGDTVVTWTATDANGNAATAAHTITVVDTTPPQLRVPSDLVVTAQGALTQVDIGTGSATDIFGAVVSHNAPASFPLGTTHVSWTAVDGNGNRTTATQRIDVVYAFGGFSGPIQPGGTYRTNRTLPLMFTLAFADGVAATAADARLRVLAVGSDGAQGDPLDVSAEGAADGGDRFRFTGNHYQFNLSTNGWSPGSYRLIVRMDDGREYAMDVLLR